MAKYDWIKLRQKYITGDYKSLKDFAERENVDYPTLRNNANGWKKERVTKQIQKTNIIIEKTLNKQAEKESDLNMQVLGVAEKFIKALGKWTIEELSELTRADTRDFVDLTGALANLQKIHRISEGLDKTNAGNSADTQDDAVNALIDKLQARKVADD